MGCGGSGLRFSGWGFRPPINADRHDERTKPISRAHKSVMKIPGCSVERDCQSRAGCHPAPQWPRRFVSFRPCPTTGELAIQATTTELKPLLPGAWPLLRISKMEVNANLCLHIPGDVHHNDSLVSIQQQQRLQHLCFLIVKEVLKPVPLDEFRNHYRYVPVGMFVLQYSQVA
jgi:hypothetical protein